MSKWRPGLVQRPDAGGQLYAPTRIVNNEQVESGLTPSYDQKSTQRACDELNKAESDAALRLMMQSVWSYVAADVEQAFVEMGGGKLTNAVAYETILDASRLETDAAKTEDQRQVLGEFRQLSYETQVRTARRLLGRIV